MNRKARAAALLALESRVRARISRRIRGLLRRLTAYFARLVRDAAVISGLSLFALPDVYRVLKALLDAAKTFIIAIIKAAYLAATRVGRKAALNELAEFGHQDDGTAPRLGRNVDILSDDAGRAFDQTLLDLQDSIRDAYDGVEGTNGGTVRAARVLTVQAAIQRDMKRLGKRVNASGAYATYQGATDAQLDAYEHYSVINPAIRLHKRWSAEPDACDDCRDLDGTVIDITGTFTGDTAYGILTGPPLHPSCRCELTLDG